MSIIKREMPLLARHAGVWAGTYRFVTPQLELLDQYDFRIRVSFPDDAEGGITYRQESHYSWPDGHEQDLTFEAQYAGNGVVELADGLAGHIRELDDRTIYLNFSFDDQPGVDVCEMIQLAHNNNDRARTWHWFKDGKLFQLTLVDERRVE
jgi:hypothetical protein